MSLYTVYTMPNCPDCKNAKDLLHRKGKSFDEVTEFTREELINLVGPVRTLPQILVKNEQGLWHVGGYKDLVTYIAAGEHPGASVRLIG